MSRQEKEGKRSLRHRRRAGCFFLLLSAALVAGAVYCFFYPGTILQQLLEPSGRAIPLESPAIPPETVWMVAPEEDTPMPEAVRSRRPVVRLRHRADGGYDLFYWGNPIRPAYSFSVEAVGAGRSALRDASGHLQETRPLPVTVPARADGRLPLQPVVHLVRLDGGTESDYAVKICVRDAATGVILCHAHYLLENPPKPQSGAKAGQRR